VGGLIPCAQAQNVTLAPVITTAAGNGTAGYSGDNGPATSAELANPTGVAVDSAGNLYIADLVNNRIRHVNASGIISTVAGNGTQGYSGDGGPATSAELNAYGVAVDSAGNLYIANASNQRIRKVDVTSAALSFGSVDVGHSSAAQSVVVSDVGNAQLNFTAFSISNNFQTATVGGDCATGTPLNPGADCKLGALSAPQTSGNPLTGAITVNDDAFNSPQSVSLTGIGIASSVSVTINTSPQGLLVSVDGGTAAAAPVSVSWTIGTSHSIATGSPQGSNGTRYTFTGWSDGGPISHSVTAAAATTSYTASFATSYLLTTAVTPAAGGSVSVSVASATHDGYYPATTSLNLTATPNVGYAFSNWTGTTNSSTNPLAVTMNSPVNETANLTQTAVNVTSRVTPTLKAIGYNKNTGVSTFNYTITNKSATQAIAGPIQVVMLTPANGALAVNKTGIVQPQGYAYWTITSGIGPKGTVGIILEVTTHNASAMLTLNVYAGHF
jgi:hypothetical protein